MQTDEKITSPKMTAATAAVEQQIKREYRDMTREAQYQTQLLTQQGECKCILYYYISVNI